MGKLNSITGGDGAPIVGVLSLAVPLALLNTRRTRRHPPQRSFPCRQKPRGLPCCRGPKCPGWYLHVIWSSPLGSRVLRICRTDALGSSTFVVIYSWSGSDGPTIGHGHFLACATWNMRIIKRVHVVVHSDSCSTLESCRDKKVHSPSECT